MIHETIRHRVARLAVHAVITAGLAFGVASAAAKTNPPERPKLLIGVILPLTGPQAPYGKEAQRGIDVAQAMLTERDADLAAHVQAMTVDDLSTTKGATDAADKLLSKDRAHTLIGSMTTPTTVAAAEVARKQQRPLVTPLLALSSLTLGNQVVRMSFDETLQGAILAEFATTNLGAKSAAILSDGSSSSKAVAHRFATAFKTAGGQITTELTYDVGAEDFKKELKQIKEGGATVILLPASYLTAATFIKQAKDLKLKAKFLGGDGWDTTELNKAAGNAATGHYFVSHFAADDTDPAVTAFVTAFKAKFGRAPGTIAALAFDSYNLTVDAFVRGRNNTKGVLQRAFETTKDFVGVTGALTVTDKGEPLKSGIVKELTATAASFKARVAPASAVTVPPTAAAPKAP
jgi:branched-chain amino acid transport system substrate-binding protein